MPWRHPTPNDFDHAHDLRKHEPRPSDPVPAAVDIALIARNPNVSLSDAARLIEQYARTQASQGVLDGITQASQKIIAAIEAPLAGQPANA